MNGSEDTLLPHAHDPPQQQDPGCLPDINLTLSNVGACGSQLGRVYQVDQRKNRRFATDYERAYEMLLGHDYSAENMQRWETKDKMERAGDVVWNRTTIGL